MNKSYFVKHGKFANDYDLIWTEGPEQFLDACAAGYEQITRAEAIALCKAERRRRKEDPMFSGYAAAVITPFGIDRDLPWWDLPNTVTKYTYIVDYCE